MPKPPSVSRLAFVGIDPGKSGGIASIGYSQPSARVPDLILVRPMPTSEQDICEAFKELSRCSGVRAVIEKVHSMPQQGVASTFTFGQGYGFLRGCLTAFCIPFQEVSPQTWQKALTIPRRRKDESQPQFKRRLVAVAKQMFPRCEGITLKTADALLIAEYCRRVNNG